MSTAMAICKLVHIGSRGAQFRVRIRALVFERFDEFVEEDGEEGAADGTDPVDPLRGVEAVDSDGGTKGAGGVEGAAGPEDAWVVWILEGRVRGWDVKSGARREKHRGQGVFMLGQKLVQTHQQARRWKGSIRSL